MLLKRHFESSISPPYNYCLAHRFALVLLRDGKRLDIIAKLQYGISYPARSRLIVTLSVCLWINHLIVLKERKEYPVNVWDVLLPVWRAYYLSGDYSYHILLPPLLRPLIFTVPSERDLAILDSCLRLDFSAFSAS